MSLLSLPPFATLSPARQRALYSDFAPQRTTNPPGFKANVAWWSALLLLASERGLDLGPAADAQDGLAAGGESAGKGSGLVLDVGEELVEQLRVPGGGRPLALGTVIVRPIDSPVALSGARCMPCHWLTYSRWCPSIGRDGGWFVARPDLGVPLCKLRLGRLVG
jgi:hypothetical protein